MKDVLTDKPISFRIGASDRRELDQLQRRLGLKRGEIIRRALNVGFKSFKTAKLPGVEHTAE